jgi:Imidazolonepropionase and related amidohydrolases
MGCGNDGGITFVWPAALPLEMMLLQEHGFKPSDILKSATSTNSRIIGMENALGTLTSGKLADMVWLTKNPLEDIANIKEISKVFKNGQLLIERSFCAIHPQCKFLWPGSFSFTCLMVRQCLHPPLLT